MLLLSCSSKSIDYSSLTSFDQDNNLRAVIEIPVGTNDKIEYNPERNTFEIDSLEGNPRVIDFLPYPVNYGFIPSGTINNTDPLDVLVLGKPLRTGQVVAVKPLGILKMTDDGEVDDKILSIPVNSNLQTIKIIDFQDLSENYPKIRDMIADWFLHYDKNADIQILGWSDEDKALEKIKGLNALN